MTPDGTRVDTSSLTFPATITALRVESGDEVE
jgi:hypothetical protein